MERHPHGCYNGIMETILEPLVRSPKFINYLDELNGYLRREESARRRFREMAEGQTRRAEFINGEVVNQMVARDNHSTTVHYLGRLLSVFVEANQIGAVRVEQALSGFTRNDYQPDVNFWKNEKASVLKGGTLIYPTPDFIAEVTSPSTEKYDRGVKFEDYAAHGVSEYWIVDPDSRFIEQFIERQGRYELKGKFSADQTIRSIVIAGFEMPVNAAIDANANRLLLKKFLV
jgi:Uma2 family endonuclease